jgi:carboxyl-terminal processing protease
MRKGKVFFLIILTMVITAFTTFTVTNLVELRIEDKVIITAENYDQMKQLEERFDKLLYLEDYVEENFYKETDIYQFDEYIIKGLFEALDDPYSIYLTAEEYQLYSEHSSGSYSGIGVIVTESEEGYIEVVSPIEGTPGEEAGLMPGDWIVEVDGQNVSSKPIDYAVSLIKGQAGTPVVLTIQRENVERFDVELYRAEIVTIAVESEMMDESIGYLRIKLFDDKSHVEFRTHVDDLIAQGMQSLIIDLRSNPGGSLDQVVSIADDLLGDQIIVYTEDRDGNRRIEKSDADDIGVPIVVLTDGGSASASEILTASIQDSESGIVMGETTFGKGVVQLFVPLQDGSGFKLTVSEYFTPNGVNIHGIGIEPDVDLETIESEGYITDEEHDGVLDYALEYLRRD